jgi:hypothetical protein
MSETDEYLTAKLEREAPFFRNTYIARATKFYKKYSAELRENVNDGFKELMARECDKSETESFKIEPYLRDHMSVELTTFGVSLIATKMDAKDLPTIRSALSIEGVYLSNSVCDFFGRYGEWQDVSLLVAALGRYHPVYAGLFAPKDPRQSRLASVIVSIGGSQLARLIALLGDNAFRSNIVTAASDRSLQALSDDAILAMLYDEASSFRKSLVVKLIKALPKTRLKTLLDRYVGDGKFRYYNVIHWLDLGVSGSRRATAAAVEHVLRS